MDRQPPKASSVSRLFTLSSLRTAAPDTAVMRALSVLTAYTEREYVGLECLWLEAMSALLLVIGMLNSCCEAKKLSESCAGIARRRLIVPCGLIYSSALSGNTAISPGLAGPGRAWPRRDSRSHSWCARKGVPV